MDERSGSVSDGPGGESPVGPVSEGAPRIVAIGASAGGLEPMERLFAALPVDTGCAFVVIQHLSPDFRSMMDALLARRTSMRIRRLENDMVLEPNCVYLNLPRSVVTLTGTRFRLDEAFDATLVTRPIDAFFSSLAEQHAGRGLAVVLSGTGSDGMHGAESMRRYGGVVLVQSPEEARFDSMPRSVICAGLADSVAKAATLAEEVTRWARGDPLQAFDVEADEPCAASPENAPGAIADPFPGILALLRSRYDTDFRNYKPATLERRVQRRAGLRGVLDLEAYGKLLQRDPDELDELYGDLLIEVTAFFRDRAAFDELSRKVMPSLIDKLRDGASLRLWVAGCASGEEAYSLAILLAEHAADADVKLDARILATDIHGRSLERAARGVFPESSVARLSEERIERHFERTPGEVRVRPFLRRLLLFSTHDVVRDTPFTGIDLLSCRNLLIYLNTEAQEHVLTKFHFALNPRSWLFLGPSENLAGVESEFEKIDTKWRIYRKLRDVTLLHHIKEGVRGKPRPPLPGNPIEGLVAASSLVPRPSGRRRSLRVDERTVAFRRAHQGALERVVADHAPPGFLLDPEGEIVHIFGDAGRLLPMNRGAFSRRITDLIEPTFRPVLLTALQMAAKEDFEGFERRVYHRGADADDHVTPFDLSLTRIDAGSEDFDFLLLMIVPNDESEIVDSVPPTEGRHDGTVDGDTAAIRELQRRIDVLERNLRTSEESLQTTIEELEASNEELQSTNEELTASNEELQSTNEELHSVNEELYTVSAEHQRRIEELSELNSDVDNLLRASDIGTVFLDRNLRLRRCTDRARELFGFGAADIGRSVHSIRLPSPVDLAGALHEVLDERSPRELDVSVEGRQYLLRLLPYIDGDGELDGVLMTSIDITELTETRSALKRADGAYRAIVEDTSSFIVRWRAKDEVITYCNDMYAAFFDRTAEEMVGADMREMLPLELRDEFFAQIAGIGPGESRYLTVARENPDGSTTYTVGYSRAIADASGEIVEYQSTGQDLSDEYAYRQALERLVETTKDPSLDHETRLQRILRSGRDYLGMESAFVSRIEGEHYHVVAVEGVAAAKYEPGDVLPLGETVCAELPEGNDVLAIPDLADSALGNHACHTVSGVAAFIGSRLITAAGSFGSLAFSSGTAREQPFSVAQEGFVMLVNSWVSYLTDSRRQLEDIADRNDYYRSLYLNVPVTMCLTDSDGCIIDVSEEWLENLGGEREARLGASLADVLESEEDRAKALSAIGEGRADDLSLGVLRAGGEVVEHEMSCRTRSIGTLEDTRLVVLSDVSARNRAITEVEEQNRRLESANENLNQFAFVASHDLQEPLRKIQQFSSFLEEDFGEALDEDGRYHLNVVVDAAERMSALIRDLLNYSRTSRNALTREEVELDAVLGQVHDDLELSLNESGVTLGVEPLPRVSGDPMLLVQLFSNLVGNAIKYRDRNRALKVRIWHDAASASIVVEDNGIGFDRAHAAKMFEPFTRLHATGEHRGSGIGLAICATVCEKHDWHITADGTPGKGSRFTIHLYPPGDKDRSSAR